VEVDAVVALGQAARVLEVDDKEGVGAFKRALQHLEAERQ
jgi:hypothetical protein